MINGDKLAKYTWYLVRRAAALVTTPLCVLPSQLLTALAAAGTSLPCASLTPATADDFALSAFAAAGTSLACASLTPATAGDFALTAFAGAGAALAFVCLAASFLGGVSADRPRLARARSLRRRFGLGDPEVEVELLSEDELELYRRPLLRELELEITLGIHSESLCLRRLESIPLDLERRVNLELCICAAQSAPPPRMPWDPVINYPCN